MGAACAAVTAGVVPQLPGQATAAMPPLACRRGHGPTSAQRLGHGSSSWPHLFECTTSAPTVDTLAGKRDLALTIPFMAKSTVELIKALKFHRKPDVLG